MMIYCFGYSSFYFTEIHEALLPRAWAEKQTTGACFTFLWLLASSSQHPVPKLSLQVAVLFQGHISSTLASVLFYLTDSSLSCSGLSGVSQRHWITDQCISPWFAVPATRDIDWFVANVGFVQILLTFRVGKWFFFLRSLIRQKYICGFLQPSEKKAKDFSHHLKFSPSFENSLKVHMFTKSFVFASCPTKQVPHPVGKSTWTSSQCQGMTLYPPLPCRLQMQIKYLQEWVFSLKRQIQHELCPI